MDRPSNFINSEESFLSESTISLFCDNHKIIDNEDSTKIKKIASTNKKNNQEWIIPKKELDKLTDKFTDEEIARKYDIAVSTAWKLRRSLGVQSFNKKTNLKKNRKNGSTLRPGTGTPHYITENQNNDYFESINTELKAYFYGLLLAEGNISETKKNGCVVGLSLSGEDYPIVYRFREELRANQKITIQDRPGKQKEFISRMHSRQLVERLVDLGATFNTEEHVIKNSNEVPIGLRRHVLRGIVDGDGHIDVKKHSFYIGSCSKSLLKTVALWFKTEFDFASTTLKFNKLKTGKDFWRLTPGGGYPLKLLGWLYEDSAISIDRKFAEYQKWKEEQSQRVPKV
jgi:hypothetical protein